MVPRLSPFLILCFLTLLVATTFVMPGKIKGDNRGTITIARCGLASGADGPHFYLVKAEKIDLQTFKGNFSTKHGALLGQKSLLLRMHTWRTRFGMRWHLTLQKAFKICLLSRTTQTYGWQSPLMVLDLIWKVMLWNCLRNIISWPWRRKEIHRKRAKLMTMKLLKAKNSIIVIS